MDTTIIVNPDKVGQVCRLVQSENDYRHGVDYIVTGDELPCESCESVYVVSLKELQRNIVHPENTTRLLMNKTSLNVIAESLEDYIKSWNS